MTFVIPIIARVIEDQIGLPAEVTEATIESAARCMKMMPVAWRARGRQASAEEIVQNDLLMPPGLDEVSVMEEAEGGRPTALRRVLTQNEDESRKELMEELDRVAQQECEQLKAPDESQNS